MRLLLDTHHSPSVARHLHERGHDVIAAAAEPMLASLPDDELLGEATRDRRAVVTENAKDFDRIVRGWAARGEHHAGVIFTSPRRFHRASQAYPANLVAALAALLDDPPTTETDLVHWLS
ncbi:MAG: DUF5615 family PIN-like protein [Acidimicrobiales bacterium]